MSDSNNFQDQNLDRGLFQDGPILGVAFYNADPTKAAFPIISLRSAKFANFDRAGAVTKDANIDGLMIFGHDVQALLGAKISRKRST